MLAVLWLLAVLAIIGVLGFQRWPVWVNSAVVAAFLIAWGILGSHHPTWDVLAWLAYAGVAVPLNVPALRRRLVTDRLFDWFRSAMPAMSDSERAALDAGTIWWDGELFTGHPDWSRLQGYPAPRLSEAEQAFLDGPVEELCQLVDDWDVTHERLDLPPQAWRFIREQGFFGLIIPEAYGGKGFSALAHSAVVMKVSSRCGDLGSTVMVPNSLGPAELLLRYGRDEQCDYYLPRLARGEEIPCFALTGPSAGSDAGSIPDYGVVCYGEHNGEQVLGLRVNWQKRYITLGPVATILGLAFKAYDPEHLISNDEALGITLALIPTDAPGVSIGRRHFPLNAAFMNGPNSGTDVFVPMAWLIGGQDYIGYGWQMLMDCLSVGRSISLPSASTASAKKAAWATGGYARVREQFHRPIGDFEGVQEALGRLAGNTYVMDSARELTATAVDLGEEPAVISAVVKYHLTERQRSCINDAMDIHGGKGICLGPNNYLGRAYQTTPIGITVEGSNILTRNMMIFGQGAIRCHPFVREEISASHGHDAEAGRERFDRLITAHLGFTLSNAVRSLGLALSAGRLSLPPGGANRRCYQQLSRFAASFALLSDAAMLLLGGSLKRRERLSARMGDVLSHLYLASAVLKRFEDDGCPAEDRPLRDWAMAEACYAMQTRLDEVLVHLPTRPAAWLLRGLIFPLGRRYRPASDTLTSAAARILMTPGDARERLTRGIEKPTDAGGGTGAVEDALQRLLAVAPLHERIDQAVAEGRLPLDWRSERLDAARAAGIIDDDELARLKAAEQARERVIAVDDFDPATLGAHQEASSESGSPR
jgi:acyl-CoA dehydrogenase